LIPNIFENLAYHSLIWLKYSTSVLVRTELAADDKSSRFTGMIAAGAFGIGGPGEFSSPDTGGGPGGSVRGTQNRRLLGQQRQDELMIDESFASGGNMKGRRLVIGQYRQ
jgi:hypothetical protein